MKIQKHRLLSALRQSIDELAAVADPLRAKEHHLAAHSILAELARGDRLHDLRDKYESGRSLGSRLAAAIGQGGLSPVSNLPPRICHSCDQAATLALLDRLQRTLESLVAASGYPVGGGSEIDSVVLTLMHWEAGLYEVPPAPVPITSKQLDIEAMLERSVRNQGGVLANARLVHCAPLFGGFGNSTVFFEAEDADMCRWPLVCRLQTDDAPLGLRGDIVGEFHLLCFLYRKGITVAQPLWLANKRSREESPFSVVRWLAGSQFEHWADLQSLNSAQIQSLASELARIHGVLIEASDSDLQSSLIDPSDCEGPIVVAARKHLDRWDDLWRSVAVAPSSIIEAMLQWLRVNAPQSNDEPVLVHGDYSPHNIVFEGDKVAGVLDWSLSHIGSRAEDLAHLLSSLGSQVQADHFMREYVAAGGRAVTPFQLKYYEVIGYFKRMVVTQESRFRFDTLCHVGPEYFALGPQFIQAPVSNIEAAMRAAEAAL
ncbi:phosphotransferase family protein [Pseudomonas sp. BF-R-01]|uniref:phosphotransferase family protein n=1 Tax=Pseudomonas sp. BF-R-01 TaxID=2832365 RepID=UPI001CBC08D4|nr:phosphotransferase family protein [Pseudomonas sp. BF-R-01]